MKKITILVVDDEPDFLELMALRVSGWGYNVIKASCGKDAIALVKSNPPDIIVMDYMMPEMDGIATIEKIRKANEKAPVIMFTAYPNTLVIKKADDLGVCAFIPKLSVYSEVMPALKSAIVMLEKNINKI